MAAELARQLPTPNPLPLSAEQKQLVGEHLAKLLKSRIAYHHSGLSYGARAGVIEPLAKAGPAPRRRRHDGPGRRHQFLPAQRGAGRRIVSPRRASSSRCAPDEILQMFGRAGRRGLDETGYVLITANEIRLLDAQPVPPLPQRRGGLERAAGPDGRGGRAGPRSVRRSRARAGTALHHQAHFPRASRNR